MIQFIKRYMRVAWQLFDRLIPAHERRLTIPTILTMIRFFLIPIIVYAISSNYWFFAVIVFCLSAITDVLDGFIARHYHQYSKLGACLDPLADKVLIIAVFMTLALKDSLFGLIPWWLVWLIFIKELLLILGAIIIFAIDQTIKVRPTVYGKMAMCVQVCALVWFLVIAWSGIVCPLSNFVVVLSVVTSIVVSLAHYGYNGFLEIKRARDSRR